MRKLLQMILLVTLMGMLGNAVRAQVADPRFRVGAALGFEGTTFINNPFNALVSEIRIPGITAEVNGRLRMGQHLSLQLSPGYTIRPYRSHRIFVPDSLDKHGNPEPFFGKTVERNLRANLLEARLGMFFNIHFSNTVSGFHLGFGPELQLIRLKKFDLQMSQDSVQFIHESSDLIKLPLLAGLQVAGGYTKAMPNGMLFQIEPFIKYSPLFTEDAKILSWGSAGIRLKWWL